MRYMLNPISLQVLVVDRKFAYKLRRYGWVRVKRVKDRWVPIT